MTKVVRFAMALAAGVLLLLSAVERTNENVADGTNHLDSVLLTGDIYEPGHSQKHPELCPLQGALLRMLILVSSAPSNVEKRHAIRQTWGFYARKANVALAFVLGASPATMRITVAAEDALFGDLVVGNSIDSYANLTLKTLSMLEWANTYCRHSPRLLKTDDDVFVNVPRLLRFAFSNWRANAKRTLWGALHYSPRKPNYTKDFKYYVSPLQFPPNVIPTYAAGAAYLLTNDTVWPLVRVAPAEPYVPLEDVFVTGILASKAGITLRNAVNFNAYELYTALTHPCVVHRDFTVVLETYRAQFFLWRALLVDRTHCGPRQRTYVNRSA